MLFRSHVAFAVLAALLLIPFSSNKLVFAIVVIIAGILPDIDSPSSKVGRGIIQRILQFFVKHRGIIHSITFAVFISVVLAIFWPIFSLGFFVGYSVHLLCDSFTKEGIAPFWPFKLKSYGFLTTGGTVENFIFFFVFVLDLFLIGLMVMH